MTAMILLRNCPDRLTERQRLREAGQYLTERRYERRCSSC